MMAAEICPVCCGCGRVRYRPIENDTLWSTVDCPRCGAVGVVLYGGDDK